MWGLAFQKDAAIATTHTTSQITARLPLNELATNGLRRETNEYTNKEYGQWRSRAGPIRSYKCVLSLPEEGSGPKDNLI